MIVGRGLSCHSPPDRAGRPGWSLMASSRPRSRHRHLPSGTPARTVGRRRTHAQAPRATSASSTSARRPSSTSASPARADARAGAIAGPIEAAGGGRADLTCAAVAGSDTVFVAIDGAGDIRRTIPGVQQRAEIGRVLRRQVPRRLHGGWKPAADQPDPIDVVRARNRGRQQRLIPIRIGAWWRRPYRVLPRFGRSDGHRPPAHAGHRHGRAAVR